MSKEPSWTDAAIEVLENSNRPWLTVPEMIKEIRSTGIKQLNHCSHSQACRSLRGALRFHARKDNGMFARNEDLNITYALRKRLSVMKVLSTKHPTHVANGLPQVPPTPLHLSPPSSPPPSTLTIEIDPTQRPPRPLRRSDPLGNFCLPSPLQSILGPKRTLSVLSDSAVTGSQRPVRKVRQKSTSKSEEEEGTGSRLPPPSTAVPPSLPEVLRLEEHHLIHAYLSDVKFVRCGVEGEPWMVQGSRTSVEELEIVPGASNEEDTEEEEESEGSEGSDSEAVHLQPRPTTQLLVRKTSHYRHPPPGEAVTREESSPACSVGPSPSRRQSAPGACSSGWKSEILPQVASLFLPGSLLVSENLKTLLNPAAYEGLLDQQKRRLVALLPTVDRPEGLSVSDGCWTNELFGSAVREWQERLAMGAFTSEHRARVRAEEKRRSSLRSDNEWKQQYYEEYWGERCKDKVDPPCFPFYPSSSSSLPEHHLRALKSIQTSYSDTIRDVPPPPSPAKQKGSTAASQTEAKPSPVPKLRNSFIPSRTTHLLSSKLKKVVKTSKQKTTIKRLGSGQARKAHLLTPLPPKTPYHTLLVALVQGSQAHQHAAPGSYEAPPHHTHPVFHDHFALLSAEHVPQEFSPPITNLLVRLPRAMFSTCMQGRAATRDHCYSRHSQQTSLKLSVPRSLLRTTCVCSGAPLMFCSMCHALYHVSCTYRNLCPSCCRCQV